MWNLICVLLHLLFCVPPPPKVMTKGGEWFEAFAEVPEGALHTQISPSAFPPSREEAEALGLHKWYAADSLRERGEGQLEWW